MSSTARTLLALVISLLVAPAVHADGRAPAQWLPTTPVELAVVDATGAMVAGAEVVVNSPGGTHTVMPSSGIGRFQLDLPPGIHVVTVFKLDFQPVTREIRVSGGTPLALEVVLKPAGLSEQITVVGAPRFEGTVPISGARLPIQTLDLPQSVEVVTQAVLQTQAALSMQDALLNVTGVTPQLGEGRRDQVSLRGFSATNDSFIDGVRDDARYYRDLSNIETVEVVKGSASALYGRGSTGGLVNRITKKPLFGRAVTEVSVTGGSYDRRRVQGDVGRSFARDRWAFRLTGAYEDTASHRPYYSLERAALSPSLAWRSPAGTELLVQADFLDDDRVPDRGIPSFEGQPIHAARHTYFGTPQDDFLSNRVFSQAATLHQPIGRSWRLRNVFRHTAYDSEFSNTQPGATRLVGGRIMAARTQYNVDATQRNVFNQTELLASGSAGSLAHTLLVGVEVGRELTRTARYTGVASDVDVLDPVLDRPRYATTPSANNRFAGGVAAAYVQEQIVVWRWRALVGGRFDRFEQELDDLNAANVDLARTDRVFSPRAGVVFRTTARSAAYASYSRSFQPSGDGLSLAANTQELEPENTTTYELGAKADLLGDRLTITSAVFRLDRRNVRTRDPIDPNRLVLVGRQRSDGIELNAAGRLLPGWDVRGGITFLDPIILRSNDVSTGVRLQGNRIGSTAARNANIWTTCAMSNGVTIGGGLFHAGDWFTSNDNLVRLDGYTRLDALAAYRFGHYEVALNLKNLFDARYYESSQGNTQIMPGAGRNGLVTVRYRW